MSQEGLGLNTEEFLHVLNETGPFCVIPDERKLFESILPQARIQPEWMDASDHRIQAVQDLKAAGISLHAVSEATTLDPDSCGYNVGQRVWVSEKATLSMLRFLARKCFLCEYDFEAETSKVAIDLIANNVPRFILNKVLGIWKQEGEGKLVKFVVD